MTEKYLDKISKTILSRYPTSAWIIEYPKEWKRITKDPEYDYIFSELDELELINKALFYEDLSQILKKKNAPKEVAIIIFEQKKGSTLFYNDFIKDKKTLNQIESLSMMLNDYDEIILYPSSFNPQYKPKISIAKSKKSLTPQEISDIIDNKDVKNNEIDYLGEYTFVHKENIGWVPQDTTKIEGVPNIYDNILEPWEIIHKSNCIGVCPKGYPIKQCNSCDSQDITIRNSQMQKKSFALKIGEKYINYLVKDEDNKTEKLYIKRLKLKPKNRLAPGGRTTKIRGALDVVLAAKDPKDIDLTINNLKNTIAESIEEIKIIIALRLEEYGKIMGGNLPLDDYSLEQAFFTYSTLNS